MKLADELLQEDAIDERLSRAQHWVSQAVLPGGWVMVAHWAPGQPEPRRSDAPPHVVRDVRAVLEEMRDEDMLQGRSADRVYYSAAAAHAVSGEEYIFALIPPRDPRLCTCNDCTFMPH